MSNILNAVVDKGESPSTTLYISGSAKFATGSAIVQKGRTEIIGNFINAKDPGTLATPVAEDAPQLFVDKTDSDEKDGVIAFIGTTQQHIYGTGDKEVQGTGTGEWNSYTWDTYLQKKSKWIEFPTISIENKTNNNLLVNVSAAISVNYIRANGDNRLAVDADGVTDPQIINTGFARIKNVYPTMTSNPVALATYSQVNLKLYNFISDGSASTDDGHFSSEKITDPATFGGSLRTAEGWNKLTGFSPPFKELGADYMFYHTLTKPNGSSITSYEGPIVDPFFRMKSGRGYFISMEVSHADHTTGPDNINDRWNFFNSPTKGIKDTKRARGGYTFNRKIFYDLAAPDEAMEGFSRFLYDVTEFSSGNAYANPALPVNGLNDPKWIENGKDRSRYELMENEKFNTDIFTGSNQITVDLEPGLNFLGNPFMAPISLNPLLGYEADGVTQTPEAASGDIVTTGFVSTIFSADASKPVKIGLDPSQSGVNVRPKYWMINQALVKYDPTKNIYNYRTTYDFVSHDGASAVYGVQPDRTGNASLPSIDPLSHVISPMQMFCLQAGEPVTIKLGPELQAFGVTRFAKSAEATKASAVSGNNSLMKDWFIVEAAANDGTADRTTVIFNDNAKPQYKEDSYDTRKGLSVAFETYIDEVNGKPTKTLFEQSKAIVYTKSSDQENLLGNAVPTQTKELALYFMPPASTQEMTLKFYGLNQLESVPGVWLIDRYLNNKTIKVTPDTEYTFVSETASNTKSGINDNRFILRFYDTEGTVVGPDETAISCYYSSSTLYISGLKENDVNSDVIIYDMQGRLMGRTKIAEVLQPWTYVKPLSIGTYIVKIVGKRNHTVKFVNLQN